MIKIWVDTFRPKAKKNNNNINDANDYPRKYAFKNKFEFVEWKKKRQPRYKRAKQKKDDNTTNNNNDDNNAFEHREICTETMR